MRLGRWVLAGFAAAAALDARAAFAAERPRLAVLMVVDGMPAARLDALRPWYTAGLERLLDEGWVEAGCNHGHLNTETAPGHASLATGAPPRVHGIVANRWFVLRDGKLEQDHCTTQPGSDDAKGAGNLRVDTLGDRLVAAFPGARVVSVAGKDRPRSSWPAARRRMPRTGTTPRRAASSRRRRTHRRPGSPAAPPRW